MKNVLRTALALAALLSSTAALAQGRAASRGSVGMTNAAVLIGIEDGGPESGLAIRGDAEFMPTRLAPNASMSLVLSLGFTRFSDSYWRSGDVRYEWSSNLFKLTPAARFAFDVAPRFGLYGDAGLGLHVGNHSFEQRDPYFGNSEASDSDVGLHLRLAGGAKFLVTPTFELGAELGVNPYFAGDYEDTTISAMLLASFRL